MGMVAGSRGITAVVKYVAEYAVSVGIDLHPVDLEINVFAIHLWSVGCRQCTKIEVAAIKQAIVIDIDVSRGFPLIEKTVAIRVSVHLGHPPPYILSTNVTRS